jgi:hypothetical protein
VATKAQKLAELQAELTAIKTQQTAARSGMSSFSLGAMSVTQQRLDTLATERTRVEKSIQRLLRGGRGIVVDMSAGVAGDTMCEYNAGNSTVV